MSSGDDIQAGRTNRAQSTTFLVGEIPEAHDVGFNGTAVLNVQSDPFDNHPLTALNGISGHGFKEGTGVIGRGGDVSGTGVMGVGGGISGVGVSGNGGAEDTGVTASGGAADASGQPGIGVEAVGGLSDRTRGPDPTGDNRGPNAPGVVATSGPQPTPGVVPTSVGSSQPTPLAQTGNVGVFGQGGDQVDEIKNDGTHTDFMVGPSFAGAGVVGRGGVRMKNSQANGTVVRATDAAGNPEPGSAGIVGIAGGLPMPSPSAYFNAGVFGQSATGHGVSGQSTNGPGVSGVNLSSDPAASAPGALGSADANRGGIFVSTHRAQVRLQPQRLDGTPTIAGLAGDLLATIDGENNARLWFCTKDGPDNWQLIAGLP